MFQGGHQTRLPHLAATWAPGREVQAGSEDKNDVQWSIHKNMVPQNGWFLRENPIKMNDLRVPLCQVPPYVIDDIKRRVSSFAYMCFPMDGEQLRYWKRRCLWRIHHGLLVFPVGTWIFHLFLVMHIIEYHCITFNTIWGVATPDSKQWPEGQGSSTCWGHQWASRRQSSRKEMV